MKDTTKQRITLLRHELKSLIDGGIKNISRFDDILSEIEALAKAEQYSNDRKRLEEYSDNF